MALPCHGRSLTEGRVPGIYSLFPNARGKTISGTDRLLSNVYGFIFARDAFGTVPLRRVVEWFVAQCLFRPFE